MFTDVGEIRTMFKDVLTLSTHLILSGSMNEKVIVSIFDGTVILNHENSVWVFIAHGPEYSALLKHLN